MTFLNPIERELLRKKTVLQVTPTATITIDVERDPDKLLKLLHQAIASEARAIKRLQKAREQRNVWKGRFERLLASLKDVNMAIDSLGIK